MKFVKIEEVAVKVGLSRSSIYSFVGKGTFPKQVRISAGSVGWIDSEVEEWMALRIAERDTAN